MGLLAVIMPNAKQGSIHHITPSTLPSRIGAVIFAYFHNH